MSEVGWALNFEMLFYVFYAAALALELPLLTFLTPTLLVLERVSTFAQPAWLALTSLVSPLVLEFLFGVVIGHFALQRRLPGEYVSGLMFAAGFVAILTIPLLHEFRFLFWGLPAGAIVVAVVAEEDQV